MLDEHLPIHEWTWADWVRARGRGEANRLMPLVRLPDGAFRKRSARTWEGVKTCNLSAWRADLVRVNGLDESYSGWGLEDSDLVIRLLHAGVLHKSARFAAPVFHLWHQEHDRSPSAGEPEAPGRASALESNASGARSRSVSVGAGTRVSTQ